jgi:hypothetical protein
MKLSILMPSHNIGTRVKLNILNACTMGSDGVEVIIRDNSGNAEKREYLSRIQEKNCRIVIVDECTAEENVKLLLNEAKGEFVYFMCDDDGSSAYALPDILTELDKIKDTPAIIGTTGIFVMEEEARSKCIRFEHFNKTTSLGRFQDFFIQTNHSIFQYSPIRRSVQKEVWSFLETLPIRFSHGDIMMNCMFLMHGRLTFIERFFCQYINANWANDELCLKSNAHYFRAAGLDASGVRLQWLIGLFEGAQTYASKYQGVHLPEWERQALAGVWIQHWFPHFLHTSCHQAEDAQFDAHSLKLVEKWSAPKAFRIPELLDDITEHFSLSSPEIAQRYYDFWK